MVQGNLTSTAVLFSEKVFRCWCVQWAHVMADPAGTSPGTPAEFCQWLDSAPWHLSQLDGVHHHYSLQCYLNSLHKTLPNFFWDILASTLSRLSCMCTLTFTCTHEDACSTPHTADVHAWLLTTLPGGEGHYTDSHTLETHGLISTQISNLPQPISYSKTSVWKSFLLIDLHSSAVHHHKKKTHLINCCLILKKEILHFSLSLMMSFFFLPVFLILTNF